MFGSEAVELAEAIQRETAKMGMDWRIEADADLHTDGHGDVIDETWFVSIQGPQSSDYYRVYGHDEWGELVAWLAGTPKAE